MVSDWFRECTKCRRLQPLKAIVLDFYNFERVAWRNDTHFYKMFVMMIRTLKMVLGVESVMLGFNFGFP